MTDTDIERNPDIYPEKSILETIQEKLAILEQTEHVRILHAVESGSRAWGFASPDSDYDIRFIYIRRKTDYLKLDSVRSVLEPELNEIYDINGWDFRKSLILARNANPTIYEWMHAPVVYQTTDFFQEHCKSVLENYFSCKAGAYHYLNTAKSNYHVYLTGDKVKLKKYFYALRPILACRWILAYHRPAPVLFSALADALLEQDMQPVVRALLDKKMHLPETGFSPKIPELDNYILQNLEILSQQVYALPDDKNRDWDALNQLFLNGLEILDR